MLSFVVLSCEHGSKVIFEDLRNTTKPYEAIRRHEANAVRHQPVQQVCARRPPTNTALTASNYDYAVLVRNSNMQTECKSSAHTPNLEICSVKLRPLRVAWGQP